jgi:hypothetical protein
MIIINKVKYCGISIVVFKTEEEAVQVIEYYNTSRLFRCLHKFLAGIWKCIDFEEDAGVLIRDSKRVYAQRCPEPGDIMWQNLHVSPKRRYCMMALIYSICFLILIPSFFLINFIFELKRDYSDDHQDESNFRNTLIVYLTQGVISCAVVSINFILEYFIIYASFYEKQMSHTNHNLSIIYKLIILKTLNTCMIPLLGNPDDDEWFKDHGLVEEVIFIVFILVIGEAAKLIFNVPFMIKYIFRNLERRKGVQSELTQRQANILFENDEVKLYNNVSLMLVFSFTILFFSPVIPGLTIIGIGGTVLLYILQKVVILRRKIVRRQLDGKLFENGIDILQLGVVTNAITALIFFNNLLDDFSVILLINLIITGLYLILPVKRCLLKLFVKEVERSGDDDNYFKYYKSFNHYDLMNPITKESGLKRLEGNSLQDSLRKWILRKLQKKVGEETGVK